jgi:hypothetical protein
MSESVAAMTRVVKVEAFSSCSAYSTRLASNALVVALPGFFPVSM